MFDMFCWQLQHNTWVVQAIGNIRQITTWFGVKYDSLTCITSQTEYLCTSCLIGMAFRLFHVFQLNSVIMEKMRNKLLSVLNASTHSAFVSAKPSSV